MSIIHTFSNFWFISLIAFHLSPSFAVDEFKACSMSYNCGELVNITYPFWGRERQGFCGRREFELNCKQNQTTSIQINSFEYKVLRINQSGHRMTIARSDLLVPGNLCPKNKTRTADLDYNVFRYWENDLQISLWYDCPVQGEDVESYRFSCGMEGEKKGRGNYAFDAMQTIWRKQLEGKCGTNIELKVKREGWDGGKNRTGVVENAVRGGFDVEYGNLYSTECEGCKESGGSCGGNGTYPFYCICQSQDAQPSVCRAAAATGISYRFPKKMVTIVTVVLGGIISIISLIIFIIYYTRKSILKDKIDEIIRRYSTHTPKRYSYSKLKKITDSFNNKLGQGGFSTVYRGKLPDGRDVAVKLLNESRDQNGQDFMNEVVSITRTSHVNIVSILGFCYERNKRALIYEYMPKGSLDKYIFHKDPQRSNMEKLDWSTVYSIVVGVARGLEYLHQGCNTRILHFDIKPHNILLDNEFCPKISDFGLAKQCRARESHVSMTGVKGTAGFMAPEVIFRNLGKVSPKSDVYSYGMLVLEMVGERKNPNEGAVESSEEYFPDWIYKHLTQSAAIDEGFWWGNTEEEEEIARKMIIVGMSCIQTFPEERPSMSDVVGMLEGSADALQIPPKPNLFGSASSSSAVHYNSQFNNLA